MLHKWQILWKPFFNNREINFKQDSTPRSSKNVSDLLQLPGTCLEDPFRIP